METTSHVKAPNAMQTKPNLLRVEDATWEKLTAHKQRAEINNSKALDTWKQINYSSRSLPTDKPQSRLELQLAYIEASQNAAGEFFAIAEILHTMAPNAHKVHEYMATYHYYGISALKYADAARTSTDIGKQDEAKVLYVKAARAWKGGADHIVSEGDLDSAISKCRGKEATNLIKLADSAETYSDFSTCFEKIAIALINSRRAEIKGDTQKETYSSAGFNERLIGIYYDAAGMAHSAGNLERVDRIEKTVNEINAAHFKYWEKQFDIFRKG